MSEWNDRQLDPVDWEQLRLLAKLTPGERMTAMAQASAFSRALLRGAFHTRFPDRSLAEINMMLHDFLEKQQERGR